MHVFQGEEGEKNVIAKNAKLTGYAWQEGTSRDTLRLYREFAIICP